MKAGLFSLLKKRRLWEDYIEAFKYTWGVYEKDAIFLQRFDVSVCSDGTKGNSFITKDGRFRSEDIFYEEGSEDTDTGCECPIPGTVQDGVR